MLGLAAEIQIAVLAHVCLRLVIRGRGSRIRIAMQFGKVSSPLARRVESKSGIRLAGSECLANCGTVWACLRNGRR